MVCLRGDIGGRSEEVRTRANPHGTGLTLSSVAFISLRRSAEDLTSSEEGVTCLFLATTVTSTFSVLDSVGEVNELEVPLS